ncbi:hypothetical protein O0L34_g16256 [Tuta absoluta]|nr:hypothetical protein O0L34_g16256 [Tuta absoluta]
MWRPVFFVLPLALSTLAIKVPVDGKDENVTEPAAAGKNQDAFYVSDDAVVDSYLIPPDQHRPAEVLPDYIVTPATYLLPPSPEKQIDYYAPTEAGEQTDWYPITSQVPVQRAPEVFLPPRQADVIPIFLPNNETYEVLDNPRTGKAFIQLPSRHLEPPLEDTSAADYPLPKPFEELELPSTEINQQFSSHKDYQTRKPRKNSKKNFRLKTVEPTLALHLVPPEPQSQQQYRKPTKLYPKKVSTGFQPVPIPISEYAEGSTGDVPRAKPVKPFKPAPSDETEYFTPLDEKKIYLYQQGEQKRKLKGENEVKFQPQRQPAGAVEAAEDTYGVNAPAQPAPTEQETSETIYRHPGRNVYPAPLRQAPPRPPVVPQNAPAPPAPKERTEFRMHGMKGPHSYQFGFDTGKGKNRQFRYEERDDGGRVKGHYGYMDRSGKLRVVNYNADPETGFHADPPKEAPSE